MMPIFRLLKRLNSYFIVSLAVLLTFLVLFVIRSADDNRLFSWQWVFAGNSSYKIIFLLIPGIFIGNALSRLSLIERAPRAALFLCSFLVTATLWTEPELIMDAARYFTQAKHLEVYGVRYFINEWGNNIVAWTDLPTIPFLYGLIFKLFGESRVLIQVFTTLLFSSTLVLTYHIGKSLWNDEIGLSAGMFLLGMPFLLSQVPLMLVDVPTMFFFTLSILTFIKALKKGGILLSILASVALFLAVFSKYSTWFLLPALGIILAIFIKEDPKSIFHRSLAIFLLSGLLIGVLVALKFDVIKEQIKLLISYQGPGLGRWGESFLSTFFFQINPFVTLAAACSFFLAAKNKDRKFAIISWPMAFIFIFAIRRIRYVLPVFPLMALMAAYGMQAVRRSELRKFITYATVISSLTITIFGYLPFARKISAINLMEAGEYLNDSGIEPVEVYTLPLKDPVANPSVAVPLLDLFTKRRIVYRYSPELYPPPEDIKTESLRFTWEYKNPRYYTMDPMAKKPSTIVIVAGESNPTIPPYLQRILQGYQMSKKFEMVADPFRYKTIAEIYVR